MQRLLRPVLEVERLERDRGLAVDQLHHPEEARVEIDVERPVGVAVHVGDRGIPAP